MKQQGKTWYTAEGKETLAKYLPKHEVLFEKLGQKIASIGVDLEHQLREARIALIDYCKEAFRHSPDQNVKRRFTFYTFDREFRIEFDINEEYVRLYRAIKKNPSSKDYELVNLDFNKANVGVLTTKEINAVMEAAPDSIEAAKKEIAEVDEIFDEMALARKDDEEPVPQAEPVRDMFSKAIEEEQQTEPVVGRGRVPTKEQIQLSIEPSIMSQEDYHRQTGPRIE